MNESLIGFLQEKSTIDGRLVLMPVGAITAYIQAYLSLPETIERVKAAMVATECDCAEWADGPLTEIAKAAVEAI